MIARTVPLAAMLPVAAAVLGVALVGPVLSGAILRWVGRVVVVPVLTGRTPRWAEVAPAPALCARCGGPIEVAAGPLALVPYLLAAGRCRLCGAARPGWLAAVEVATGGLFALAAAAMGWSAELPAVLALLAGLVAVSAVDLVYMRIPTSFVHAAGAASTLAIVTAALLAGPPEALGGAVLGAALYAGFLGAFYLVSPANMGLGDVRLAALIGAVVGWVTWAPDQPVEGPVAGVLGAAFVAGLVGTVVGAALLVLRRQNRHFPFGPAMAVGAVAALLLS